MEKENP